VVKDKGFVKMYQNSIGHIATVITTVTAFKVYFVMAGNIGYDGICKLTQKEIAVETGLEQPNVSKAIKDLLSVKLLEEVKGDKGNRKYYKVPNVFFCKG